MKRKNKVKVGKQMVDLSLSTNQLYIQHSSQANTIQQNTLTIRQMNRLKVLRNCRYGNYKIKDNAFFSIKNDHQSKVNIKANSNSNMNINMNVQNRCSLYNCQQGSHFSGYSARYASVSTNNNIPVINSARYMKKFNPAYKSIDHDSQNNNQNIYKDIKVKGLRVKTQCEKSINIELGQKQNINRRQLKYKSLQAKSKSSQNVDRSIVIFSPRQQNVQIDSNRNMGVKKRNKNRRRFLTQITNKKQNHLQNKNFRQGSQGQRKYKQNNCDNNQCSVTIEEISSILCELNQHQQSNQPFKNKLQQSQKFYKKAKQTDLSILKNIDQLDTLLGNYRPNDKVTHNQLTLPESRDKQLQKQARFKTLPSLQTQSNTQQFIGKQKDIIYKGKLRLKSGLEKNILDKIEGRRKQKNKVLISRSIDKIKYKFPKGFFCNITNNQQI